MPDNQTNNSRQVPKDKTICANKKYYDILYCYLQCNSFRDKTLDPTNRKRYFEKSLINFSKLAPYFNLSRQTLSTKFKNLKELGLIKEYNNELYELTLLDNNLADLIPYPTLKLMTDTLSENCINVYVYLLSLYYGNGCNSVQFTLEQVKKNIGICSTTRSNDDIITNILLVLKKLGLIEYHLAAKKQENSSFDNIKTIYQIDVIRKQI